MKKILDYFKQITEIPHCSQDATKLRDFLVSFATQRGYEVQVDTADNILIKKGSPNLALQAHYDMVCVGNAPKIKTYIKDGWMMAENSTLGADNGIAIAMMMVLIDEKKECEFLFTSDEEVGLIGASALAFKLSSKQMLNLDSEDEAEVYIGCAGGVDIEASKSYKTVTKEGSFYSVEISGLAGGHSGVEIHKNIPNAIKLFAKCLKDKDVQIASIEAGERVNSIPVNLKAILYSHGELKCEKLTKIEKIDGIFEIIENNEIIEVLYKFENAVLSFNDDLGVPENSINLALLSLINGNLKVQTSARAMSDDGLKEIEKKYKDFFENYGYKVKCEGKYPAWKPEINSFSKEVEKAMIEVFGKSEFKAIHAGLECAIISEKYPDMKFTSIGPNIESPHSTSERVEIASVEKIFEVVKKVVASYEV
jgi:dipeptidase D